jgi:hypothetical protein
MSTSWTAIRASTTSDAGSRSSSAASAHLKFYYQHFDSAQQDRFIELYNERKLPLEPHFGLYVKPYFARVVA